uniref:glycoside hydrolase family 5 protein n=1 Tax=uncultured Caulobacter sp. TaxID=158749 RepID=UPI0025EBA4E2|nr:cellulase family glycosylhydrolase [uncultured Caulobacter sp.]
MSKPSIDVLGSRFVDAHGRHAILRGVNLGGDCKVPWPDGGTDRPSDFSDHRTVSFVGRPFPLEEADTHLARIARWGFNTLRLLTTWEAVEHAGPGQYDEDYLDYFTAVVERAQAHGLFVFVDFHQDVWSRMSGGDGAPGWVFEALGLDFARFDAADAAHVMQHRYDYTSEERRQEDRYPMMSWASNYRMAANGIAWSAFFAGQILTPDWTVEGRNVQHFLQDHYLGAMAAVARRVAHLDNVIGFDTFNEPGLGWVGLPMSQPRLKATPEDSLPVWPGAAWTPLDGLRAARGRTVDVANLGWSDERGVLRELDRQTANEAGVSIWRDEGPDPFEQAGAWRFDDNGDVVLDEDFFRLKDGQPIDHENQCMGPFFARVAETVRAVRPDWLLFAELCPYLVGTGRFFPDAMPERSVNASHWYDIDILRKKRFDPDQHTDPLKAKYFNQMAYIAWLGSKFGTDGAPTLIGEFGIPYDLNHGEAFEAWARGERGKGVWAAHAQALSLMYDALDALKLSSTQWNYTAGNRNDLRVGDGWNQEDLSIFSPDQIDGIAPNDPDAGARALLGFCRPYAPLAQGVITTMRYAEDRFELEMEADPAIDAATQIYVPQVRFPNGVSVSVSQGAARWTHDREAQQVLVWAAEAGPLSIVVEPA